MKKANAAVKQNTVTGNDIEILPGQAYVLTRNVYETARIDGGPRVRVFRQGERFVGTDFYGESGLWPVDSVLAVPEGPDDARDLLGSCIMNDEPLPGAVRDDTWVRVARMVVEVPHDLDTLRAAAQCRAREEQERREMEMEDLLCG